MGLSISEKVELATYQLKDVFQAWYVQQRYNRTLWGDAVTWEVFKKALLEQFCRRYKREDKVVEFINLFQGGTSLNTP